jgi:NAD(P)-dependent dehydrogenase (short-subunit alcohol dehydrogenase family)
MDTPADSSSPEESKVYVLIGGSGGIGAAVAARLARRGARLLLAARDEERLAEVARPLEAETFVLDATRPEEVEACLDRALEIFGRLDGAANLVGSILLKPAHLTSEDEWLETLALNLGTAFHLVRSGAKRLRSGGGSLVLMSSAAASTGLPNHEAIAAAKAGVEGLVRAAASSYSSSGVRVNAVAPGLVQTPLSARITANPAAAKASEAMHPLGRLGEPEEVARVIEWLLGPEASWVTGQVIGIDGGLARVRPRGGR